MSEVGAAMKFEDKNFLPGLRVLVVDDDPTSLTMMEALLQKCQYHVTTTNQGKEALKMFRENRNMFDIVICDVSMPDIDGLKLLRILRYDIDLGIPIIMMSAFSDSKLIMSAMELGACDYLVKPMGILEVQNIWQHVLRRKKNSMVSGRPRSGPNGSDRQGTNFDN